MLRITTPRGRGGEGGLGVEGGLEGFCFFIFSFKKFFAYTVH